MYLFSNIEYALHDKVNYENYNQDTTLIINELRALNIEIGWPDRNQYHTNLSKSIDYTKLCQHPLRHQSSERENRKQVDNKLDTNKNPPESQHSINTKPDTFKNSLQSKTQ